MENSNLKNEQLLLDMAKELEKKNKTIWTSMWAIMIVSMTALFAGIFISAFLIPEGVWLLFLTRTRLKYGIIIATKAYNMIME